MDKIRVAWIDNLKFVAIILVVWGHNYGGLVYVRDFIYAFHMPLFFMISGYLFKTDLSYRVNLIKSFKTLLLPYFYLNLFLMPLYLWDIHKGSSSVLEYAIRFVSGDLYWFIMALFLMRIASYPILKKKIYYILIFVIFLFLIVLWIDNSTLNNLWIGEKISRIIRFTPFFILGYILKQTKLLQSIKHQYVWGIAASIVVAFVYFFCGSAEINRLHSVSDILVFVIEGVLISYCIYLIVYKLKAHKVVETISNGTIMIYILHFTVLRFSSKIPLPDSPYLKLFIPLFVSILIVLLFYFPIRLTMRKMPWLLGK